MRVLVTLLVTFLGVLAVASSAIITPQTSDSGVTILSAASSQNSFNTQTGTTVMSSSSQPYTPQWSSSDLGLSRNNKSLSLATVVHPSACQCEQFNSCNGVTWPLCGNAASAKFLEMVEAYVVNPNNNGEVILQPASGQTWLNSQTGVTIMQAPPPSFVPSWSAEQLGLSHNNKSLSVAKVADVSPCTCQMAMGTCVHLVTGVTCPASFVETVEAVFEDESSEIQPIYEAPAGTPTIMQSTTLPAPIPTWSAEVIGNSKDGKPLSLAKVASPDACACQTLGTNCSVNLVCPQSGIFLEMVEAVYHQAPNATNATAPAPPARAPAAPAPAAPVSSPIRQVSVPPRRGVLVFSDAKCTKRVTKVRARATDCIPVRSPAGGMLGSLKLRCKRRGFVAKIYSGASCQGAPTRKVYNHFSQNCFTPFPANTTMGISLRCSWGRQIRRRARLNRHLRLGKVPDFPDARTLRRAERELRILRNTRFSSSEIIDSKIRLEEYVKYLRFSYKQLQAVRTAFHIASFRQHKLFHLLTTNLWKAQDNRSKIALLRAASEALRGEMADMRHLLKLARRGNNLRALRESALMTKGSAVAVHARKVRKHIRRARKSVKIAYARLSEFLRDLKKRHSWAFALNLNELNAPADARYETEVKKVKAGMMESKERVGQLQNTFTQTVNSINSAKSKLKDLRRSQRKLEKRLRYVQRRKSDLLTDLKDETAELNFQNQVAYPKPTPKPSL